MFATSQLRIFVVKGLKQREEESNLDNWTSGCVQNECAQHFCINGNDAAFEVLLHEMIL